MRFRTNKLTKRKFHQNEAFKFFLTKDRVVKSKMTNSSILIAMFFYTRSKSHAIWLSHFELFNEVHFPYFRHRPSRVVRIVLYTCIERS